ncbi:MAG: hypothetical protein JWP29_5356 [Rhodoferax sp.]|nr:hypothetical protein [Rhodoferax sp.]
MNIKLIGGPADGVVLKAARQRNDWVWQHNGRNFYYKLQSRAHAGLSESTDSTEPPLYFTMQWPQKRLRRRSPFTRKIIRKERIASQNLHRRRQRSHSREPD